MDDPQYSDEDMQVASSCAVLIDCMTDIHNDLQGTLQELVKMDDDGRPVDDMFQVAVNSMLRAVKICRRQDGKTDEDRMKWVSNG